MGGQAGGVTETITIARRFCGPPDSGNGGYCAGTLARFVDAPVVEVTLRRPPPLDRALRVERHGARVTLHDGDALVAEAVPGTIELDLPEPVAYDVAVEASLSSPFRDMATHPFPTCFGCGPARDAADGLRMFWDVIQIRWNHLTGAYDTIAVRSVGRP